MGAEGLPGDAQPQDDEGHDSQERDFDEPPDGAADDADEPAEEAEERVEAEEKDQSGATTGGENYRRGPRWHEGSAAKDDWSRNPPRHAASKDDWSGWVGRGMPQTDLMTITLGRHIVGIIMGYVRGFSHILLLKREIERLQARPLHESLHRSG